MTARQLRRTLAALVTLRRSFLARVALKRRAVVRAARRVPVADDLQ